MKQEGKSDILATITQPKTDFTYADGVRPEAEVTSDGVIEMASISAGKWSGLFNFTVTSSVDLSLEDSIGSDKADISTTPVVGNDVSQDKHSEYDVITSETRTPIKVTATNSDGVDINASASTIVGSEAKKLLDSLNESGLIEDTEEVDALIEVESDDFEGIADTTFDVSDIANPGDTVVILHFDEEKQMWEHIGTETVDENGKVNGDFTSYSPVAFVKKENDGTLTTHYHNLEEHIQDPTCTQDGIKTYTCKDYCGYVTVEFIDPLGHDYKTSSTASSCTEEGYTTYTCERCGDSYVDDTVPALGHSYGDWVTVKEPNCTETGSKQKTCSACGDVVTESINALGHDYVNGICTKCNEEKIYAPGLYDENDVMLCSWENSGIDNTCSNAGAVIKNTYSSATKIIIPESVTSIDDSAFALCGNLTSVTIPSSVTSIGDSAFALCGNLTSVTIQEGVTNIGEYAFESCHCLTDIVIPEGVTEIKNGTFNYCSSLTSISIPSSVINLGGNVSYLTYDKAAFYGCYNLTDVTIKNGVINIGNYVFYCCDNLTNITIPASVENIGEYAFCGCSNLSKATIYSGNIGNNAFDTCLNLSSVVLKEGVTSIGDYAFSSNALTSITIPASVEYIGMFAFEPYGYRLPNATFKDPYGWYQVSSEGKKTAIPSSYLSNSSKAATVINHHILSK